MILEDYCSYEVAKLLKEKGFDEEVLAVYIYDKLFVKGENEIVNAANVSIIPAPTHQMAMKWLREAHQLHISVDINPIYGKTKDEKGRNTCGLLYWHYMASGEWLNEKRDPFKKAFVVSTKSYEEAIEAALKYCLENLI